MFRVPSDLAEQRWKTKTTSLVTGTRGFGEGMDVATEPLVASGHVTGTIRASASVPSSIRSRPMVPCGWRLRSVGEPGLKIRSPSPDSSIGMCE